MRDFARERHLWDGAGSWQPLCTEFLQSPAGESLLARLDARLEAGAVIYPPYPFKALEMTPAEKVKVVILGQDPYHGPGQAVGMSFSVPPELRKLPPSLNNIFREIALEYDTGIHTNGDLSGWAEQGVLLLNAVLTVEEGEAASHGRWGWEKLTDAVLAKAASAATPCVYMLWGNWAQAKADGIRHNAKGPVLILTSNHPSPLSALRGPAPFIGCGHFRKANEWLQSQGAEPVRWLEFAAGAESAQGFRLT